MYFSKKLFTELSQMQCKNFVVRSVTIFSEQKAKFVIPTYIDFGGIWYKPSDHIPVVS